MDLADEIKEYAKKIEPELIHIRRTLHQYPELAESEYETCRIISSELGKIPELEIHTGLARGTGIMALLRGSKENPGNVKPLCILLRADIDALPVMEDNDLPFKSKNAGYMHACGHDAHATWLIGAAKLLTHFRDQFYGTVKFVFQPGEERGFGAVEMICEDHVLENPKVDYAFAGHGWPSIDAGKIGIARKYAFGCPGGFHVTIKGKGGHGSWPYKAVNPIMTAAQIINTLPQILSDRIDSIEPRVISIGTISAGTAGNIIPDTCSFAGTIRAVNPQVMEAMKTEMERVIQGICLSNGTEYEYECHYGKPVKNDPEMTLHLHDAAAKILGGENVYFMEKDNLGGENFSEFSSRIPSAYMFVGIRNLSMAEEFDLHSPNYMLDESVIAPASAVFALNTIQMMNGGHS